MRFALIQSDERVDGAALALARTLRGKGHQVTFVTPQIELIPNTPRFAAQWMAEGFAWLPVTAARFTPAQATFPRNRSLATARSLSGIVEAFDVAWFFERHWAMPSLRNRKFRDHLLPLIVLNEEPTTEAVPNSVEEINRASSSQYASKLADFIVNGWMDVPLVESNWNERRTAPARPVRQPLTSPAITVCVPYFEAPEFLPETLRSLERQTLQDFTVVVIDDGSHTPIARQAFDTCAAAYAGRGWKFLRQVNKFPGAARNRAAREAVSEFLLFFDSDDIAMPEMLERFLRAALLTGDDCLVVPNYGFRDDPEGRCILLYDPPGDLIGSMGDDMQGGACIFVRLEAFRALGGFTELRGVGYEDYEFHVRCELAGLRWDVLPDLSYRYRMPRAGGVSLSTAKYANQSRVVSLYQEYLRNSGLIQLPLAFASTFWRLEHAKQAVERYDWQLAPLWPIRLRRRVKLLLLTSYFPYGMKSGWYIRLQKLIRYFGSRYDLTLVAPIVRDQFEAVRREACRDLRAVRVVTGLYRTVSGTEHLPFRVRKLYSEVFSAAVRALPTHEYQATLIDQVFMAEFRNLVKSPVVLTEHNIESRLLWQASERSWKQELPEEYRNAAAEALLLERYENMVWPEFPLRAVVSEMDRELMNRRVSCGTTVVAANGADPDSWLPGVRCKTATVLFPAALDYLPNVDAVELLLGEIWPAVLKRIPGARLILAGREPALAVKAAAAGTSGVELCPNPKSMDKVARRASVTVVPLRLGSGTRCKILDSMAWGLPVVSTTLGAEGILATDDEHLLIRDDPHDFAEAICSLLQDEDLWQRLRTSGRELVRQYYSWDRVFEPLEEALIELIS